MHAVWLMLLVPLAGIVAWRFATPLVRKFSFLLTIATAVGVLGWFGFHFVVGTELTESVHDRFFHAVGVIVSALNVPATQFLAALTMMQIWPERWRFRKAN